MSGKGKGSRGKEVVVVNKTQSELEEFAKLMSKSITDDIKVQNQILRSDLKGFGDKLSEIEQAQQSYEEKQQMLEEKVEKLTNFSNRNYKAVQTVQRKRNVRVGGKDVEEKFWGQSTQTEKPLVFARRVLGGQMIKEGLIEDVEDAIEEAFCRKRTTNQLIIVLKDEKLREKVLRKEFRGHVVKNCSLYLSKDFDDDHDRVVKEMKFVCKHLAQNHDIKNLFVDRNIPCIKEETGQGSRTFKYQKVNDLPKEIRPSDKRSRDETEESGSGNKKQKVEEQKGEESGTGNKKQKVEGQKGEEKLQQGLKLPRFGDRSED